MTPPRSARLSASPPLFDTRFLDFFSRIHPAVPALIFVPVISFLVWLGADRGYGAGQLVLLVAGGLALWTLTEYWLHRLLFHWEPSFPGGERLHFIIHGVHHEHPNDRMRLVMPPALSIPLGSVQSPTSIARTDAARTRTARRRHAARTPYQPRAATSGRSSDSRSHPARVAPAVYVASRNSSSAARGEVAVRTAS